MKNFTIKIRRYDPETAKSSLETHEVPYSKDLTVLDAINSINGKTKFPVAHRSSCRMGICGSCSAIVNGQHALMCSTFCKDLKQPIIVEPMRNFPVIKDLITDTDDAMDKFRQAKPFMKKVASDPELEQPQTPKQMKKYEQTNQCIKCLLCYSACPVYGNNKKFVGPATAALAQRYNADSRDNSKNERLDSMTKKDGVYDCSFIGECSVVCPKNVDPAAALQKLKVMGVLNSAKPKKKKVVASSHVTT
jgi:fumarate reductase iron-sulfur subunit